MPNFCMACGQGSMIVLRKSQTLGGTAKHAISVAVNTLILEKNMSDVGDGMFYWSKALHRISVAEFCLVP